MGDSNRNPKKTKKSSARKTLAEIFLKAIEDEPLKWKQGFISPYKPVNGVYNTAYKGLNRFALQNAMVMHGYNDPRFFAQSYIFGSPENRQREWDDPDKIKVIKGEKPVYIESKFYVPLNQEDGLRPISPKQYWDLPSEEQEKYRVSVKNIAVYNADQLTGVGKFEINNLKLTNEELKTYVDTAVDNMRVSVYEDAMVSIPCYIPAKDKIMMPTAELFHNEHEYFTTKLHEMAHATGHESRLKRVLSSRTDIESYAKEELRVEIASCFIASDLGLDVINTEHAENHAAYIQSWHSVVKEDHNVLISAIYEAEGIADYMIRQTGYVKEAEEKLFFEKDSEEKDQSFVMGEKEQNKEKVDDMEMCYE